MMTGEEMDRLVARGMEVVRPLIEREARIVERAEQMYRDLTGATTPLHSAEMGEVDRMWWYRIARISLEREQPVEGPCGCAECVAARNRII